MVKIVKFNKCLSYVCLGKIVWIYLRNLNIVILVCCNRERVLILFFKIIRMINFWSKDFDVIC